MAAPPKRDVEEFNGLFSLQLPQLADVGRVVLVAEGLGVEESFIRTVTQQVFVEVSVLAGHWPSPFFGEDLLDQDDDRFSGVLDFKRLTQVSPFSLLLLFAGCWLPLPAACNFKTEGEKKVNLESFLHIPKLTG